MKNRYLALLAGGALLALASCGTQSPSGFLANYDQLSPGGNDYGAKMAYTNPATDFSKYDRIMFDPIVLYFASGHQIDSFRPSSIELCDESSGDERIKERLQDCYNSRAEYHEVPWCCDRVNPCQPSTQRHH